MVRVTWHSNWLHEWVVVDVVFVDEEEGVSEPGASKRRSIRVSCLVVAPVVAFGTTIPVIT